MEANVRALQNRMPHAPALVRYDEVGQILTGQATANAADGVAWVQELCTALAVPPLSQFGITPQQFPAIVEKSQKASSMKGNPIPLSDQELTGILQQAV
jgi:alcohol dehydrogenase class IV